MADEHQPEPEPDRVEEPPELDEDDENALDQAWESIDQEEREKE